MRGCRHDAGPLSRKPLPSLGAAVGENATAVGRRHTMAEAVPPLADDLARLIGALHGASSADVRKTGPGYIFPEGECQRRCLGFTRDSERLDNGMFIGREPDLGL